MCHDTNNYQNAQVEYVLPDVGSPVFRRVLLTHLTPAMGRCNNFSRFSIWGF